jgi:hypothetical protein
MNGIGMALSDAELRDKLRAYTRRVVTSLSFERCRQLGEHHFVVEYEGVETEPRFLTYKWDIGSFEEYEGRECARIHTHVCDDRVRGLGSVYTPLICGAFIAPDDSADYFPLGNLAASDTEFEF